MPPMEAITPGSITSLAVTYALVADEKSTSERSPLKCWAPRNGFPTLTWRARGVVSFRPWLGGHMPATIGRRDLIAGLGGVAIVWPPTAPAQGVNREQAQL